jgi:hypothetical protein
VKHSSVDPALTFGLSLVLSVGLWFPTLRGTLNGEVELTDAAIRFLVALAIAWACVFGVSSLVARYARRSRKPPSPPDSGTRIPEPTRHKRDARLVPGSEAEAVDSDAA